MKKGINVILMPLKKIGLEIDLDKLQYAVNITKIIKLI